MAPSFRSKSSSNGSSAPGQEDASRFDLSAQRVKSAADDADKFRFSDAPGAQEAREQRNAPASKDEPVSMFGHGDAGAEEQGPLYGYRKHRLRKGDEVSPFNAKQDARNADPRQRTIWVLGIVVVIAFFVCLLLPNRVFSDGVTTTLADFVTLITVRVGDLALYVTGSAASINMQPDIWRYLIIAFSGAALGITGAVYQGSLKNALASPTTLGVTAGGTLGSMLYVIVTYSAVVGSGSIIVSATDTLDAAANMSMLEYFLSRNGQALCSLAGCVIVVVIVLAVAHIAGHGKLSSVALIVAGQVMMMTINAFSNLIRYYYSEIDPYGPISQALRTIRSYSFNTFYYPIDALAVGVPIIVCIVIIMRLRLRLSLLTFTDEEARSMGLSVTGTRNLMIGICTLMTAIVIAFGGNTGFVGFLVPHVTRRIIGPDFKYLVPASALLGSTFLMVTYYITSLFESFAGGVGLFTSVIGGVMFIVIAVRSRKTSLSDGI